MLSHIGTNSTRLWWPSLTKDMQTEQLLCWSGIMTDTKHTASGFNEEEPFRNSATKSISMNISKKAVEAFNDHD